MKPIKNVTTPVFRVSYPNVFKPRLNELSGKMEFSVVALFPKGTNLTEIESAIKEVAALKWGADEKKWPKGLRLPLKNQADRAKDGSLPDGHEDGAFYLNLKSEQQPGVVNEKVEDIIDPSEFYAGCFARATVSFYAYDQKVNRGVGVGLRNLQKVKEGKPLGGKKKATDDFTAVATENPTEAPEELL